MSKVVATGGMTCRVYTKLYISIVEPILMYGSGIWGTKQFSCISFVQNRACKFFLSIGKHTLNIAARGDMGWTSCFTKQHVNLCRLWCRLRRTDESRNSYKILKWISRRSKGWTSEVEKTVNKFNVRDVIHNISISTKCVMRAVSDKLLELDNTEWFSELFDDRRNVKNGNKLRTYQLYKNSVKTEQYIKVSMSRRERRTMALFRSGALPIAIETPVDDRLCDLCDMGVVENEKHFLLDCPLYSDLRYDLYYECSKYIDNLTLQNSF